MDLAAYLRLQPHNKIATVKKAVATLTKCNQQ
jgi:hypothetical protein